MAKAQLTDLQGLHVGVQRGIPQVEGQQELIPLDGPAALEDLLEGVLQLSELDPYA